jgi:acyl carrier protein
MRIGGLIMATSSVNQTQRTRTANGGSVSIEKVRALIAKHLDVDIRRVTDDADLSRDLGADWLDRLELIILVEEMTGLEIGDPEVDRIEVVGDLILYVDERSVARSAPPEHGSNAGGTITADDRKASILEKMTGKSCSQACAL